MTTSTATALHASQCSTDETPLLGGQLVVVDTRALAQRNAKPMHQRPLGAEVFVQTAPGWTASMVHAEASCQIARYEAGELDSATDPLAVRGATVDVREQGAGFVVRIEASDRTAARDIATRARAL